MKTTFSIRDSEKLRDAILSGDVPAVMHFLRAARSAAFVNIKSLLGFHDALLLLVAYPPSEELFHAANQLLGDFHLLTKKFLRQNKGAGEKLVNSGLRGTEIHGAFTFPTLNELRKNYPGNLFLHSVDESGADAGSILKHYLPAAEFETLNAGVGTEELLEELFGPENALQRLLVAMDERTTRPLLRDQLFDDLKIYAGLRLDGSIPDRSTARGIVHEVYVHKDIHKKADAVEFIAQPLPSPENLTMEQEKQLILHSMCMLATLNRETDPVSTCAEKGVTFFQLERGVSIALFSMDQYRRMPLESYVGYMLFRNGVPNAYGGAWIFGNRALFGINIFEPFRGGESALTILQLLRVYHQYFGVQAFSVEPYQFGKDNPEGIESGAYWFYYKLGFRSDDKQLAALAETEMSKMRKQKSYRSSHATLRKFTGSRITWRIDRGAEIFPDPSAISQRITAYIRDHFEGDREAAAINSMKKYGVHASGLFAEYALLFASAGRNVASIGDKIKQLVFSKYDNEHRYNGYLTTLLSDIQ